MTWPKRFSPPMVSIFLLAAFLAPSQAAPAPSPDPNMDVRTDLGSDEVFPTYRVMPGDVLQVMYLLRSAVTESDYVLGIMDKIEITSPHHPEMEGIYTIRTDGKITLPYKSSLKVVGMTMDELITFLQRTYSDVFRAPEFFVKLDTFGGKLEELRAIISSDRRGQIFEGKVRPDGFLSLPIIGDVRVTGRTLAECESEVEDVYRRTFPSMDITLLLADAPTNVFYVFGQVSRPGQFSLESPTTLLQAVALAGADLGTAGLRNVVVVSLEGGSEPVTRVIDVKAAWKKGGPDAALYLRRNDVVLVPKSTIAKINQWMQQYVSDLFLFNGFNYNFGNIVATPAN